jgi:hypothetical protein
LWVFLPGVGIGQLFTVFVEQLLHLFWRRLVGILAILAQPFTKTLRQNAEQCIGKIEGVHAHVEQADDRLRGGIGVQGSKHQMAGQRGFDADAGGFRVAHFADHDDVRVGTQEGFHHRGEIKASLFVDLHLAQAFLSDFYRVFGCPDFGFRAIQVTEDGVQGGRLTGTGRTTDEEQTVGFFDAFDQVFVIARGETKLIEFDWLTGSQNAHHYILNATGGGNGGNAQLNIERAVLS